MRGPAARRSSPCPRCSHVSRAASRRARRATSVRSRPSGSTSGGWNSNRGRCTRPSGACAPSRTMWLPPSASSGEASGSVVLALRLTSLALLLRPMGPGIVRASLLAAAAAALLYPRMLVLSLTWYAMAALVALRIAADWPLADNHIYLLAAWCLALGLALGSGDPWRVIGTSSRLLVGIAFAMAVLWKGVLSPDYVDGRFFRVTLLTDDRLAGTARLLGGLTRADIAANREALRAVPEGAELLDPPAVIEPPAFRRLATSLTWGALVSEALVALAFLAPLAGSGRRVRHAVLLSFCAMTYAIAPVAGFGWILLAIGAA